MSPIEESGLWRLVAWASVPTLQLSCVTSGKGLTLSSVSPLVKWERALGKALLPGTQSMLRKCNNCTVLIRQSKGPLGLQCAHSAAHKGLPPTFPPVIFLRTLGSPDKPPVMPRWRGIKARAPDTARSSRKGQTLKSCPEGWKSSRLRDTGVNKDQTVLPSWG